jgi:Na+-driven multidrug efflux pump
MSAQSRAAAANLPFISQVPPQSAPASAPRERDARAIAAILDGPIVPVMLRLGLPTLVVLVVQTLVGVVETYFVSFLGTPALIFGWGPFPPLGIAGAGAAVAIYYVAAAAVLTAYLLSGRAAVRLLVARIESRLVSAIMRVGGLSAIGTIQANLTVALVTGAVGIYGAPVIAGYGIASRLDYLLIPLLFGFGTAAVTMVGANVGAGNAARARCIAWIGAAIGGGATGALYLRTVAPFYLLFGMGYMLYFASQGADRVLWPVLAGTVRLLLAGVVGWLSAVRLGVDLGGLFAIVAAASVIFGLVCVAAVKAPRWGYAPVAAGGPAK